MAQIKELLKEKKYASILKEIEKELSASFDLTIPEELDTYEKLNEARKQTLSEIMVQANNSKDFQINNLRSLGSKESTHVSSSNEKKDINFLDSFKQIFIVQASPANIDKNSPVIYVADSDKLPSVIKKHIPDLSKISGQLLHGNFLSDVDENEKNHYCIVRYDKESETELEHLLISFRKVIIEIYEKQFDTTLIKMDLFYTDREFLEKSYFFLLLGQILYWISIYNLPDFKPKFLFEFKDARSKELFEKVVNRLNMPENKIKSISKTPEQSLNSISQRAWTRDTNYIKTLKSVLSIIDEEDVPILITGATGVGKSMLAKIIHEESTRYKKNFKEINCGGLTAEKLDQKLWGWEKGAFTNAVKKYDGIIKQSDKGTLFLDEIDRASAEVRHGLLTFLDDKKYDVLGGGREEADVRLLFGTNKDLAQLARNGTFEEDFYYRIKGRMIRIPSLKERVEDIELISQNILDKLNEKKDKYVSIDLEAMNYLKGLSWPGNVRELNTYLRNVYFDTLYDKENILARERLENTPINNLTPIRENDFENFMDLMKKFLDDWDPTNNDFLKGFLRPILAKIYVDDYSPQTKRTQRNNNASAIIGMDGSKHNTSLLYEAYALFEKLKEEYQPNE